MESDNQLMRPSLLRKFAIITKAANQTMVSHALFFFQRIFPSQYAGQKTQAQAEEGGGGSINFHAEQHLGNTRPQQQQNQEMPA